MKCWRRTRGRFALTLPSPYVISFALVFFGQYQKHWLDCCKIIGSSVYVYLLGWTSRPFLQFLTFSQCKIAARSICRAKLQRAAKYLLVFRFQLQFRLEPFKFWWIPRKDQWFKWHVRNDKSIHKSWTSILFSIISQSSGMQSSQLSDRLCMCRVTCRHTGSIRMSANYVHIRSKLSATKSPIPTSLNIPVFCLWEHFRQVSISLAACFHFCVFIELNTIAWWILYVLACSVRLVTTRLLL